MLKVASLFSQILGQVLRIDFQKLVIKHGAKASFKRLSFLDPVCFNAVLSSCKGSPPCVRYATAYKVATGSLFLWV